MKFQFNDGGRKDAGYKGFTRDCTCRSIAIVTGLPYQVVYDGLNDLVKYEKKRRQPGRKSSARIGVHKETIRRYLETLGYLWTPTMQIGQGCKVHLRKEELPAGRLVVYVSGHTTAVIDGEVHDLCDPSRDGTRCVYGYFSKGEVI